jgi:hypothetical protein
MALQQQISGLTEQVQQLGQMLMQWAQGSSDLSRQQQTQMLDLAVLLEPITPALEAIQQQQLAQDQRLARIEATQSRITMALPSLRPAQDGQPPVQPRLASREQLAALPAKVVEALEAARSPTPKKA